MERTVREAAHLLEARAAAAASSASGDADSASSRPPQPPSPLGSPGGESRSEKVQRRAAAGIAWRQSAFLVSEPKKGGAGKRVEQSKAAKQAQRSHNTC